MASSSSSAAQPENERRGAFDGIITTPASTFSSRRSLKPCYEVFINHRGPDVKETLARDLYAILTDMSLSVFLDSKELEYGDRLSQTIEAAMADALVHIAIFSEGYADSAWCLAELAFMLKSGAKIIPIFYHVDPSDLRWVDQGKGVYVESFKRHEQKGRYSSELLQEWKTALHQVSDYRGQIVKRDEDEKRLLKNIVSCVQKEINDSVPFEVAKYPVGMKEIIQDFFNVTAISDYIGNGDVQVGNGDVQVVGIWGMGGAGKTTLAKALYNKISSSMPRSSIVFNVRDGLLHEKQKKLLSDLGIEGLTFDNIEDGKRKLSMGMRSIRALIVLDDVDNLEQLNALLPTKDGLQKGSLIIVTTRAYDVLKCWHILLVYKMKPLCTSYATQLFCWHAFLNNHPLDEFKELVERFLDVCKGLPLSLKVLGAQLFSESRKEIWEDQLNKISRIAPYDIIKILKTSYDTLDDEAKVMFVDIACFFIGVEISVAIEVWNGMGWTGLLNWESLLHKCMVELDDSNCIKMHDHLRDLGKSIGLKQWPYKFWIFRRINNIHQVKEKYIEIRGIDATSFEFRCNGHGRMTWLTEKRVDDFRVWCSQGKLMVNANGRTWSSAASLVGLKYLVISGDFFNEGSMEEGCLNQPLDEISGELVWLRWFEIPYRNLPLGLSLQNLSVLELISEFENDLLEELWGETENEAPLQLRHLHIHSCTKLQGLPKSIGHLHLLKKIIIRDNNTLSSLPDEICLLKSLEHLELADCTNLTLLPGNFGNLSTLRHLSLADCERLKKLPISFKNLTRLKYLVLSWCCELTSEDLNCLENIKGLEFLIFAGIEAEELPRHMRNQVSLTELYIESQRLRELPDDICELRRLKMLTISGVKSTSLPSSLGDLSSLRELHISTCSMLERLPDSLGNLSLTELSIRDCSKLERLPDSLGGLSSLRKLFIKKCSSWSAYLTLLEVYLL